MKVSNWFSSIFNRTIDQSIINEDILKFLYKSNEEEGLNVQIDELENGILYTASEIQAGIDILLQTKKIINSSNSYSLTNNGKLDALKLIRRHRIYEKYLAEKTGFSKSSWHRKAEEMEHALSDAEVDKMAKELGNPRFDPHGDPIPTKEGKLPKLKGIKLSQIKHSCTVKVLHIEDEPKEVYKQIVKQGLHIRSIMTVDFTSSVFATEGNILHFNAQEQENITVIVLEEEEEIPKGIVRLTNLRKGEQAIIQGLSSECRGINRRRLLDLGFVKGTKIKINMVSPLSDPIAYLIRETLIALRKEQTDMILIKKIDKNGE